MALSDLKDPALGPVLSGLIWFLLFCVVFLVVTLPFSRNPAIQVAAITPLTGLMGLAIRARGKIADRRGRE